MVASSMFPTICASISGRANGQERLVGEDGRAFRHGEDIAGETEAGARRRRIRGRRAGIGAGRGGNRSLRREFEVEEIIDGLGEAGRDDVVAIAGQAAEKQFESGDFVWFCRLRSNRPPW